MHQLSKRINVTTEKATEATTTLTILATFAVAMALLLCRHQLCVIIQVRFEQRVIEAERYADVAAFCLELLVQEDHTAGGG